MVAVAPLPSAMALLADAVAAGPTATLSVPDARLSARIELEWKYLIPAPLLTMLLTVVPRLLTDVLVANNWLPLTASVLALETCPAATLVICRSPPAEPTLTTPPTTGVAPA